MKKKPTKHFKNRTRTRLNVPPEEIMRLYRHGRPALAADLPRFGRDEIGNGRRARIVVREGIEILVITCQRERKLITVLLPVQEWDDLKAAQRARKGW
jgi:hypothetical protein